MQSRIYMAASVPRFLRQSKLSHLPLDCVIVSRLVHGQGGAVLVFDIIMLQEHRFQNMRMNMGLQQALSPAPGMGTALQHAYIPTDTKRVVVPADVPDSKIYPRDYFLKKFGLATFQSSSGAISASQIETETPANKVFTQAACICSRLTKKRP